MQVYLELKNLSKKPLWKNSRKSMSEPGDLNPQTGSGLIVCSGIATRFIVEYVVGLFVFFVFDEGCKAVLAYAVDE